MGGRFVLADGIEVGRGLGFVIRLTAVIVAALGVAYLGLRDAPVTVEGLGSRESAGP